MTSKNQQALAYYLKLLDKINIEIKDDKEEQKVFKAKLRMVLNNIEEKKELPESLLNELKTLSCTSASLCLGELKQKNKSITHLESAQYLIYYYLIMATLLRLLAASPLQTDYYISNAFSYALMATGEEDIHLCAAIGQISMLFKAISIEFLEQPKNNPIHLDSKNTFIDNSSQSNTGRKKQFNELWTELAQNPYLPINFLKNLEKYKSVISMINNINIREPMLKIVEKPQSHFPELFLIQPKKTSKKAEDEDQSSRLLYKFIMQKILSYYLREGGLTRTQLNINAVLRQLDQDDYFNELSEAVGPYENSILILDQITKANQLTSNQQSLIETIRANVAAQFYNKKPIEIINNDDNESLIRNMMHILLTEYLDNRNLDKNRNDMLMLMQLLDEHNQEHNNKDSLLEEVLSNDSFKQYEQAVLHIDHALQEVDDEKRQAVAGIASSLAKSFSQKKPYKKEWKNKLKAKAGDLKTKFIAKKDLCKDKAKKLAKNSKLKLKLKLKLKPKPERHFLDEPYQVILDIIQENNRAILNGQYDDANNSKLDENLNEAVTALGKNFGKDANKLEHYQDYADYLERLKETISDIPGLIKTNKTLDKFINQIPEQQYIDQSIVFLSELNTYYRPVEHHTQSLRIHPNIKALYTELTLSYTTLDELKKQTELAIAAQINFLYCEHVLKEVQTHFYADKNKLHFKKIDYRSFEKNINKLNEFYTSSFPFAENKDFIKETRQKIERAYIEKMIKWLIDEIWHQPLEKASLDKLINEHHYKPKENISYANYILEALKNECDNEEKQLVDEKITPVIKGKIEQIAKHFSDPNNTKNINDACQHIKKEFTKATKETLLNPDVKKLFRKKQGFFVKAINNFFDYTLGLFKSFTHKYIMSSISPTARPIATKVGTANSDITTKMASNFKMKLSDSICDSRKQQVNTMSMFGGTAASLRTSASDMKQSMRY